MTKCPKCSREFSPDTVGGLCPACLLEQGLNSQAGVTAAPETVPPPDPASQFDADQPISPEQLMALLPQFDEIELIGRGGMGVVYKARQKNLDRFVAVKVLSPAVAGTAGFAERFSREARAMARLSHPCIVTVYDFGRVDHAGGDLYFLTMEFVDGSNLRSLLKQLSPPQALAIVPQICEALQYAHDIGIVHRDIKPENILVDKKGRVKIADFGLAKLLQQAKTPTDYTLTLGDIVMGTPNYMAPEQLEHPTEVDHRADLYSLGVVFYEMLTGQLPKGRFALPSQKVQIDVRFDEIVLKALEHNRELRYQQASEVRTSVESVRNTPIQQPGEAAPIAPTFPFRSDTDKGSTEAVQAAAPSPRISSFPLTLKILAVMSIVVLATMIAFYFSGISPFSSVVIVGAALGLIFFFANHSHGQAQIGRARALGLWPALGEVPTQEHVKRMAQAGETILAIRLCRQMGAGLAEARAIVAKQAVPAPPISGAVVRSPSQRSRMAVAGAVFSAIALVVGFALLILGAGSIDTPTKANFFGSLIGIIGLIIGIAFGAAGLLMGWLATRKILQSEGRLRGLQPALFAAMLFPAIALAIAVGMIADVGTVTFVATTLPGARVNPIFPSMMAGWATLALAAFLVWRFARKHERQYPASAGPTARAATIPFPNFAPPIPARPPIGAPAATVLPQEDDPA